MGDIMAKRKARIRHAEVVRLFAARLRELRHSRGLTQAELARQAHVTVSYIGRLEAGGAAPGIDLVDRLAHALGTTLADLLPTAASPDTLGVLQERARRLFEDLLRAADRETLQMLNPLLARLVEASGRR
jgi:transcriptional regulator with XRE-family HTH domain